MGHCDLNFTPGPSATTASSLAPHGIEASWNIGEFILVPLPKQACCIAPWRETSGVWRLLCAPGNTQAVCTLCPGAMLSSA